MTDPTPDPIRDLLAEHAARTDERGEIKSCKCGMLFGIQHRESGDHRTHVAAAVRAHLTSEEMEERVAALLLGVTVYGKDACRSLARVTLGEVA